MNMITLALLVLFILALALILRMIMPIFLKFMSWRNSALFAGIYLGILLLALPVLYFLPMKGFTALALENPYQPDIMRIEALPKPKLDELKKLYLNSRQTFKTNAETLKLKVLGDENPKSIVMVRAKDNVREIKVETYLFPQWFGGIDLTKQISPPRFSFQDGELFGELIIESSKVQRFDFKYFETDFTLAQFKPADRNGSVGNVTSGNVGRGVIVIYIPADVKVEGPLEKYNVQAIEQ